MSESTPAKPASTQHKRLMRAVYTFFGSGVICGFLLPLFLIRPFSIARHVDGKLWLNGALQSVLVPFEPLVNLVGGMVFQDGYPKSGFLAGVFAFGLCFMIGLVPGLPLAMMAYFMKPRSDDATV